MIIMSPPDSGGDILFLPWLSVCLSISPFIRLSVRHAIVLLYNLKNVQDIFMKLHRNIKHHQMTCKPEEP